MSQFISVHSQQLRNLQEKDPVTGAVSKIVIGHNSPLIKKMRSNKHIENRISLRIQQESRQAKHHYQQTMTRNYGRLRKCLRQYALTPELRMEETMEIREERGEECPFAKERCLSAPAEKRERKVYIERKYNRELAIRAAIAAEMEQITVQKTKTRKALSEHIEAPLAKAARRQIETGNGRRNGNPILHKAEGRTTIKKRVKKVSFA